MDPNALAPWRDLSLVWLILWAFLFMLVPGIIFFFAVRGMLALHRWIRKPLTSAQLWARRIQETTDRVSDRIAAIPIALHSTSTRVSTTMRSLVALWRNQ